MPDIIPKKRVRRMPGQFVQLDLGGGKFSYARVAKEPLIAFYDKLYEGAVEGVDELDTLPIVFTLAVINHAITKGRWPVIAKAPLPSKLQVAPRFCKQDAVTGTLTIYHEVPELAPHYERPAIPGECEGLETAAVWEPEHF
jgi:hypothetical protein